MKQSNVKPIVLLTTLALSLAGGAAASDTNGFYPPAHRLLPSAWKASWAPDSKRLAFTRHTGKRIEGKEGISVLELESGTVTNLTAEGKDPAWSPDGKYIAFVAHPDTGEEVWVVRAAGGEPVKISKGQWPAWTPDSKRVLIPTFSRRAVLSFAVDVPQEEPTIFFTNAISGYPGISADASRIAFGSGGLQIFDTKTEQLVAKLPSTAFFTGWSPDGRQVAFADVSGARSGLWIFDVKRGGAYQAATNGTRPAWSPDGKRLVYDVWSGYQGSTNWTKELWVIETASLPRDPVLTNQLPSPQLVGQSGQSAESLVGKPAPTFTLPLLDGGDFDLAAHKDNHIVLLDFWATWCGPCRAVMPALVEISREYADKGVKYFAINLREDSAKIRSYLEGAKLDIAVPLDKDGVVAGKYGVSGIPAMFIVGKDGNIKKMHVGSSPDLKAELTRSLDNLLAGKPADAGEPTKTSPSASLPPQPSSRVISENIVGVVDGNLVEYSSPPNPSRPVELSDKAAAQIVSNYFDNLIQNQSAKNLDLFVSPETQVVGISKGGGREIIWRRTAKHQIDLNLHEDNSTIKIDATPVKMVDETLAWAEVTYHNIYIEGRALFTLTAEGGSWRIASLVFQSRLPDPPAPSIVPEKENDLTGKPARTVINAAGLRPVGIPPRDAQTPQNLIDLSAFYNAGFIGNGLEGGCDNDFSELPVGIQELAGTRFDVRGLIQLYGNKADPSLYPDRVTGLPACGKCRRVHLLHGLMWVIGRTNEVARYVFHYADGTTSERPIVLRKDVLNWWMPPPKPGDGPILAWSGHNPATRRMNNGQTIQIYKTTWENPRPDVKITSIDFISTKRGGDPFLVAITTE